MRFVAILAACALAASAFGSSASAAPANDLANAKYGGVKTCFGCHRTEKQGEQYGIWQKSAHSKAYEVLGTPEAKEIAEKAGVKDPQQDIKCLTCHVTAANAPASRKEPRFSETEGVGCEACHGAGQYYKKISVMKELLAGTIKPASVGLTMPTEATCVTCHNAKSPTFKSFDFKTSFAKIKHMIPEATQKQIIEEVKALK